MSQDIDSVLLNWDYKRGELSVRLIESENGKNEDPKIQIRMDLGLMQLEWSGRPDGTQPNKHPSLLAYYSARERRVDAKGFTLSREDCWALGQEAMQYYWRRISFFELKEYKRAERDARHNLDILALCSQYAENEEDRQMAEQHRIFVTTHRIQAEALSLLESDEHKRALGQIRLGIQEIEAILAEQSGLEAAEDCAELRFLVEWEKEVEESRPLSLYERLSAQLKAAVEQEQFEKAAVLRDRLQRLETQQRCDRRQP